MVILDEAQNYNHTTLEEVRLLLGLNLPEQPAFALVLIGDEYLLASLKLRNQRALYSRLACQFTLEPWNPAQCAQYLNTGLSAVGLSSSVLESAATELLASGLANGRLVTVEGAAHFMIATHAKAVADEIERHLAFCHATTTEILAHLPAKSEESAGRM